MKLLNNIKNILSIHTNVKKSVTSAPGLQYVIPSEDVEYGNIDIDDLRNALMHEVVDRCYQTLGDFTFQIESINILPPKDKDVAGDDIAKIQQMIDYIDSHIVHTSTFAKATWKNKDAYGSAFISFDLGKIPDSEYSGITNLKLLNPYSFSTEPTTLPTNYMSGRFLEGIIFDIDKGEYLYYQTDKDGTTRQIEKVDQLIHIKSEVAEFPDGRSRLANLIPTIKKLQESDVALMQSISRGGAPIISFKVHPPDRNDIVDMGYNSDNEKSIFKTYVDRHKEITKFATNQNRGRAFVLPAFVDVEVLNVHEVIPEIREVREYFVKKIVEFFICNDFTESDGQAISKSSVPTLDFLKLQAEGRREEIGRFFINLWQLVLKENGKEDWSIEINWKDLNPRDILKDSQVAKTLMDASVFTPDEIRDSASYVALTDEQKEELGLNEETEDITKNIKTNIKMDADHIKEGNLSEDEIKKLISTNPLEILRGKEKLDIILKKLE